MQLPTVERTPTPRPAGPELVVPAAVRVIPVAPVNASLEVQAAKASASVVNQINPDVQARFGAPGTEDPLQGGSAADGSNRGWTQAPEAAPKPEEPPKEPISKILIDHIQSLWAASARVVDLMTMSNQAQTQASALLQRQADANTQDLAAAPGVIAKEALTYSPSKIKKTDQV